MNKAPKGTMWKNLQLHTLHGQNSSKNELVPGSAFINWSKHSQSRLWFDIEKGLKQDGLRIITFFQT